MGPSLDLAIQQFLDHLRVERELTPATVEAYGRDLSRFAHFAAGRTVATADAVRSIDILDFLVAPDREEAVGALAGAAR